MEGEISKSGYNEASFKMQRLHEWQRSIAHVNSDLGKFYPELGVYGFEYKITMLENLVSELWGKMDDDAKKKLNQYRDLIKDFQRLRPIYKEIKINSVGDEVKQRQLNRENLNILSDLLYEYNMYINELLEKAGYSTFTVDTFDGDPFN